MEKLTIKKNFNRCISIIYNFLKGLTKGSMGECEKIVTQLYRIIKLFGRDVA